MNATPGDLTYAPHVGATARERPDPLPPPGYRLLRARVRVGEGPDDLAEAGRIVTMWGMHRAAGFRVAADEPRARPGVVVDASLGAGPLRLPAPCRVVWTVDEPDRVGFAYGSLPGHPLTGEEAFEVERAEDGAVWLKVTAFSRGATWYTRAAWPLVGVVQRAMARWYGRSLRRTVRARQR
ncbi:DUF1990 family protein [Streptomyces radicis]|uniref:DUF1990 domain-containing protein n=1 Tax=Streptomyces radicis TaxID=1750517 RepID=A0A3A9WN90_9ACTN|nr:DUF1990 domain-containing protein [Streptomyces radicis]RKN07637.1 DUF1990 domain-containing protein [Streptomyces radicis]RKN18360.1 DUF1990 domain-containing protein [Streptomyces radicis]